MVAKLLQDCESMQQTIRLLVNCVEDRSEHQHINEQTWIPTPETQRSTLSPGSEIVNHGSPACVIEAAAWLNGDASLRNEHGKRQQQQRQLPSHAHQQGHGNADTQLCDLDASTVGMEFVLR
jgi:ribosomal protein L16 Arg81 hydroxylase